MHPYYTYVLFLGVKTRRISTDNTVLCDPRSERWPCWSYIMPCAHTKVVAHIAIKWYNRNHIRPIAKWSIDNMLGCWTFAGSMPAMYHASISIHMSSSLVLRKPPQHQYRLHCATWSKVRSLGHADHTLCLVPKPRLLLTLLHKLIQQHSYPRPIA